ncbi:bifunctional 5,10-methylenetetrahydrofolate dehydrogenase/5,10-methenyltetrahydrofolate cyclohydrolase [Patescibacteria group bacterium]|nr:bifunctional 5,10-methylenetetrahydrofolate dehydrogenase/5,10-methenyltetrahydrofolate cyclohydrolase [Patescibacteria group bacterium]
MPHATILEAGSLATDIKKEVAAQVARLRQAGVEPKMAVVAVAATPASLSYLESQRRVADKLGIALEITDLGNNADQGRLEAELRRLSADSAVHGVMIQLPLPQGLDTEAALDCIDPSKDVDGLTAANCGLVASNHENEAIPAATPQACIMLAESYVPLAGKQVAVVGRGRTVGRPLVSMLLNRHATVTVCHSRTTNLAAVLKSCEVVMVAVGKPGVVSAAELAAGQVVIDAGISVMDGKVVGDVDPAAVETVAAISPVPGGVGTLTSAIIFRNLLRAIELQSGLTASCPRATDSGKPGEPN